MNTEEAIELITQNYSASEGSLIFSLHERNTFSSRQFWDLYDSIDTVVNASHHNDQLTEQISSCYQAILKMLILHFDANDLYAINNLPYDYPRYIDCLDYAVLAYYRKNPDILKSTGHDIAVKRYIDCLDKGSIPWNRMFTAYGTAENYCELLSAMGQTLDTEQWEKYYNRLSDFEHQSTLFPPAPFVLVFLVRILQQLLRNGNADAIVKKLLDRFLYYAGLCNTAESMDHAEPLRQFSDLLNDENLLPEDHTEEDLLKIYEDPYAISDQLFYSFYYYAKIVLSEVPDILDYYKCYPDESKELRRRTENIPL